MDEVVPNLLSSTPYEAHMEIKNLAQRLTCEEEDLAHGPRHTFSRASIVNMCTSLPAIDTSFDCRSTIRRPA